MDLFAPFANHYKASCFNSPMSRKSPRRSHAPRALPTLLPQMENLRRLPQAAGDALAAALRLVAVAVAAGAASEAEAAFAVVEAAQLPLSMDRAQQLLQLLQQTPQRLAGIRQPPRRRLAPGTRPLRRVPGTRAQRHLPGNRSLRRRRRAGMTRLAQQRRRPLRPSLSQPQSLRSPQTHPRRAGQACSPSHLLLQPYLRPSLNLSPSRRRRPPWPLLKPQRRHTPSLRPLKRSLQASRLRLPLNSRLRRHL